MSIILEGVVVGAFFRVWYEQKNIAHSLKFCYIIFWFRNRTWNFGRWVQFLFLIRLLVQHGFCHHIKPVAKKKLTKKFEHFLKRKKFTNAKKEKNENFFLSLYLLHFFFKKIDSSDAFCLKKTVWLKFYEQLFSSNIIC